MSMFQEKILREQSFPTQRNKIILKNLMKCNLEHKLINKLVDDFKTTNYGSENVLL